MEQRQFEVVKEEETEQDKVNKVKAGLWSFLVLATMPILVAIDSVVVMWMWKLFLEGPTHLVVSYRTAVGIVLLVAFLRVSYDSSFLTRWKIKHNTEAMLEYCKYYLKWCFQIYVTAILFGLVFNWIVR